MTAGPVSMERDPSCYVGRYATNWHPSAMVAFRPLRGNNIPNNLGLSITFELHSIVILSHFPA